MTVTTLVAFYGASIATLSLYWNYRNSKTRINIYIHRDGGSSGNEKLAFLKGIKLIIVNESSHSVKIKSIRMMNRNFNGEYSTYDMLKSIIRYGPQVLSHYGWFLPLTIETQDYFNSICPIEINARDSHQLTVPIEIISKLVSGKTEIGKHFALGAEFRFQISDSIYRIKNSNSLIIDEQDCKFIRIDHA